MKKLILLLLPFLTLTACNKSEPIEPDADVISGTEVFYEEFMNSANNTQYSIEEHKITRRKVSGFYSYTIDNTIAYSISGSVELDWAKYNDQQLEFSIIKYNLNVKPNINDFYCWMRGVRDEQREETLRIFASVIKPSIAGRFAGTYLEMNGIRFIKDYKYLCVEEYLTHRFPVENMKFYLNPYQVSLSSGSLTDKDSNDEIFYDYFLSSYNDQGVESKFYQYNYREEYGHIYKEEKNILIENTIEEKQ